MSKDTSKSKSTSKDKDTSKDTNGSGKQHTNYISALYSLQSLFIEGQAFVVDDEGRGFMAAQGVEFGIFEHNIGEEKDSKNKFSLIRKDD